jgi:N6-L-threonylcarbamoyladenine synthase
LLILGIDTSCDDTSVALVRDGSKVLSNVVSSQVDLHAKYGGVVPEIASRRHLETMPIAFWEALDQAGASLNDLECVAVTSGPGLLGSLLVGVSFAKSLALGLGIPVVGVQHLEGHIMANFLRPDLPQFPVLNLVVSGGHSDLILLREPGVFEVLGETRDDAAGEVFDKVARELGLPFPGGPYLDKIAEVGDPQAFRFPHPKMSGSRYDYSFSGLKTRALQGYMSCEKREECVPHLAASFRYAVVRELLYHVPDLLEETGAKAFAVCGGVASNSLLRKEATALGSRLGVPLFIPPRELCTDNGAMIAAAAFYRVLAGKVDGPYLNAESDLPLTSWAVKGG